MKKFIAIPVLLLSAALFSCNGSDSPEVDNTIVPTDTAKTANSLAADSSQVAAFANTVNPTPAVTATGQKSITAATKGGSSAANPAHGQPGHRCDIAVGAPLNSPVVNTPQPGIKQNVTAAPSATVAAPAAPATPVSTDPNAKLNPAHGQPGHDCSIAVGAPLKKN